MEPMEKYQDHMREAIKEAQLSLRSGNKGFGAVVVKEGRIIARAHDTDVTDQDPTAHAEIEAVRIAARLIGRDLSGCAVVSTHEPCPMCATAVVWANVSTLVYGYGIKDALRQGRKRIDLECLEIFRRAGTNTDIVEGVLRDECEKLYKEDIREHIKRFRGIDRDRAKALENDLLEKRRRWLENNRDLLERLTGDDLEKAHQLLCLKLGIESSEAPVAEKTGNRIVFHSKNHCPSLEACIHLGLDTREICRWIYEKPTEELVKAVNPRLRFTRNYERIRPQVGYCEEMFYLED